MNTTAPRFVPFLSNLPLAYQGKTRDMFTGLTSPGLRLIVATDRLSTHDVVHKTTVPDKGAVLTALTVFWITKLLETAGIRHHLIAHGTDIYKYLPRSRDDHCYPRDLHLRAIVVEAFEVILIEFIWRLYLAGSLFGKFYSKGLPNPYGIELDRGLQLMHKFTAPIFTPTEKSDTDPPLNTEVTRQRYPAATELTERVFRIVGAHMQSVGLELVDSKFEVAVDRHGRTHIVDEIATPDSSRFCSPADIRLGSDPPWFDKQIARDAAERMWAGGKKYPLEFGPDIVSTLSATYRDILKRITGAELETC